MAEYVSMAKAAIIRSLWVLRRRPKICRSNLQAQRPMFLVRKTIVNAVPFNSSRIGFPMVPPIPETQQFELPDEGSTKFVSMMCIEFAEEFDYENVWIEYMTYFPVGVTCTSNNTEGQTSACVMDEDGRFHFAFAIEFDFTAADISSFHMRFRVRSEDFWGRQYLAGYGSLTALLHPGRTDYRVECWRPIKADDPISELREFFIGQAIDINFFNMKEVLYF
ncbi:hypothetical protein GCK32_008347 [Trichostrongylus colubriformis]|uniref:Uncharacterized protein n=1 Tax=Trichostrongylus colubriformis TaxID=6319 RepID=A0AAN8IWL6_TRICO